MAEKPQTGVSEPPSDARTIQWAPNASAGAAGKPGQGSIGACDACRARKVGYGNGDDSRLLTVTGTVSCEREHGVQQVPALFPSRA